MKIGIDFFRPHIVLGYQNYHNVHMLTFFFFTLLIGKRKDFI